MFFTAFWMSNVYNKCDLQSELILKTVCKPIRLKNNNGHIEFNQQSYKYKFYKSTAFC